MKKWVIQRPSPNSPLEVWEYITTEEEAREAQLKYLTPNS